MISVIMSVYNADKYLRESIESILNQTFTNFEFIIINDASTDNSLKIIEEYKKKDKRIILISNENNAGLASSLNLGIKQSKYDFIARMDADDISEPERLEKQLGFLLDNKHIDILGTFASIIDEDGEITAKQKMPLSHYEIVKMLVKLNPIIHPTIIFRKMALNRINFYNPKFSQNAPEDYELWFRAVKSGLIFYNLPEYLIRYRINNSHLSRKNLSFRVNEFKIRLKGYKLLKVSFYKYIYLFVPLILGIAPAALYHRLKTNDPRQG